MTARNSEKIDIIAYLTLRTFKWMLKKIATSLTASVVLENGE